MNKTFFVHHVFMGNNESDNKREVGSSGWEEQKDFSLPTDGLWYTPASESFLLMSAKKPTLLSSLYPLNLKKIL